MMIARRRSRWPSVSKELTVLNRHGLHARPATELVRCVRTFESTVWILAHGKRYHADRIMDVLLSKLDRGSTFTLEASGPDAEEAIRQIELLLSQLKETEDQAV